MVNKNEAAWPRVGGALWLDAVNTLIGEGAARCDLWPDFAALCAWAREFGALDEAVLEEWREWEAPRQERVLERAREVRARLRGLCEQLEEGAIAEETKAHLNAWIGGVATRRILSWDETGARWQKHPVARDETALWHVLAGSAGEYLADPARPPLRRCGATGCVLWFLDLTKNRSRRWCSMESCGNRSKAARHYERRKK